MMRVSVFLTVAAIALLGACGKPETAPITPTQLEDAETKASLISDGREIVEANCLSCHGIGASDDSIRTDAPVLRRVLVDRDVESLRADFREGIHVGAEDMPDFSLGPIGTDAVIAYIESIQVSVPARTDDESQ
jgi:mono/diheme cytochrome c family protein